MELSERKPIPSIEELVADHDSFAAFLYSPWEEALQELNKRRNDTLLEAYVKSKLPTGIPEIMRNEKSMVLFRHLATPNFEMHRFLAVADSLRELYPCILEYTADKFNDRNMPKYFLGKLCFHKGMNSKSEAIWESVRIIDFNGSNNKPISSISTIWGQSLVDFHHELFLKSFPYASKYFSDISEWLHGIGPTAKDYYKAVLCLFIRDGVLFENFFLDKKEISFTRNVILPAFLEIYQETGVKPLIVTLAPTEIEGDQFWHSYPYTQKGIVDEKMKGVVDV